jgi:hypothetical protein
MTHLWKEISVSTITVVDLVPIEEAELLRLWKKSVEKENEAFAACFNENLYAVDPKAD